MTYAPRTLLAARTYIIDAFGVAAAAVGIVGDSAHRGGYHCGKDRTVSGDYSVVESSRDRNGLSEASAGLDVGSFTKGSKNLRHFSKWLVAECARGAPDTKDIREVIYSPDGRTVKRWDRLGRRSSGDSSHLWHTHISFFRDSESRDKTAVFRRYIEGTDYEGDDMGHLNLEKGDSGDRVEALQIALGYAGFPVNIDGDYGAKTAAAVLSRRKWMGSTATDGEKMTPYATEQLGRAISRREAIAAAKDVAAKPGPAGPRAGGLYQLTPVDQ